MTPYEQLGGDSWLRPLVQQFVERVYADAMIGFFFANVRKERIVTLELQHAAEHLGAPNAYRGREMGRAHAKHAIGAGHFSRRLVILREVLAEWRVPDAIARHWIESQERLRPAIVRRSPTSGCPQ